MIITPDRVKAIEQPSPERIKATTQKILQQSIYQYDSSGWYQLDLSWLLEKLSAPIRAVLAVFGTVSPYVAWVITIVLILVAFGLIAHIVYTFYVSMRPGDDGLFMEPEPASPDPEQLIALSHKLAEQGQYADATRKLYLAALYLLENKRNGRVMQGLTNTEYLKTFNSRWVIDNLTVFVELINSKWYRAHSFNAHDYTRSQQAFQAIQKGLEGMR